MAKEARFIVLGEPKPKGRPRFSVRRRRNKKSFVSVWTPVETMAYEEAVRTEYKRQCGGVFFEKGVPVTMEVTAYYQIPKSASKKKAGMMREGAIRPTKRPDSTNVLKAIEDSINGVAYHDDSQIVDSTISRFYSETPRVEVVIKETVWKGETER